jgi:hypothetical protein
MIYIYIYIKKKTIPPSENEAGDTVSSVDYQSGPR